MIIPFTLAELGEIILCPRRLLFKCVIYTCSYTCMTDRARRDRMVVGFTTVQSVPITTQVVNSNPVYGEMYSITCIATCVNDAFKQKSPWAKNYLP
jgi:hypothetical protein